MRNCLQLLFVFVWLLIGCKKQRDVDPVVQQKTYSLYGSDAFTFYAINASTGLKRWEFKSEYSLQDSPRMHNGIVYFKSSENRLFALDAVTGEKRWDFKTGTMNFTIAGNVVYMVNDDRNLYALDAITGVKRWEFTPNLNDSAYMLYPVVANGLVYLGIYSNTFYALDAATGTVKWTMPMPFANLHLKVVNGLFYTAIDGDSKIRAFDALTGVKQWEFELGDYTSSATDPLIVLGTIYVTNSRKIAALDATTGLKKWDYIISEGLFDAPPTLADGVLYATTSRKKLHGIEAATGKKRQESSIPLSETIYAVHASPIVDKGLVYVSGYREMCALEVGSGKVRWKVDHGNMFRYYYPVLAGGLLYSVSVGAMFSNVKFYAVDATTGVTKWEFPTVNSISYNPIVVED